MVLDTRICRKDGTVIVTFYEHFAQIPVPTDSGVRVSSGMLLGLTCFQTSSVFFLTNSNIQKLLIF